MIKQNVEKIFAALNKNTSKLKSSSTIVIAVSKNRSKEEIIQAIDSGITHFGENYIQEAEEKWS